MKYLSCNQYISRMFFIMFYVLSHQIFQHPSTDIFETLMSHGVALTAVEFGVAIRLPLKCP